MEKVFGAVPLQLIVLGLLFGSPQYFAWQDKRNKKRRPLDQMLLRAPGSYLIQRVGTLNDRLVFWVAILAFGPGLLLLSLPKIQGPVGFAIAAGLILICGFQLYRTMVEARGFKLGLLGERTVAEELNKLMFDGCHVFHDYPGGPDWNIDHIVVAPSGVYAIETKTWTKRGFGEDSHRIVFDGVKLNFPRFTHTAALRQASNSAADLSKELTKATAEPVNVKAILTFPGWNIVRTGKSGVNVLKLTELKEAIIWPDHKPVLSAEQIQQIASVIDLKCRDVVI